MKKSVRARRARANPPEADGRMNVLTGFSKVDDDIFLTETEAGRVVGISPYTLKRWRLEEKGKGPRAVNIHGCIRYRTGDIREWKAGLPEAKRATVDDGQAQVASR